VRKLTCRNLTRKGQDFLFMDARQYVHEQAQGARGHRWIIIEQALRHREQNRVAAEELWERRDELIEEAMLQGWEDPPYQLLDDLAELAAKMEHGG
jgi:hypothetical protein